MDNEYIVLTSRDYNTTHHQNKHYNFITTLQCPREFDGEWEVGLAEIDFNSVNKPQTQIKKYFFKCYQFEELSENVFGNWKPSEVYTKRIRLEIPEGLEGMIRFEKELHERHPIMKKFISFKFGFKFSILVITPVVDMVKEKTWHVMVPDSNCKAWSELYDHDFTEQESIDWHVKIPFIIQNPSDPDYNYTPTAEISSSTFKAKYDHDENDFSSAGVQLQGSLYNWYNLNLGVLKLRKSENVKTYGELTTGVYPRTLTLYRQKYNLRDATDWFYIYCNLIEPSRVAGTSAQVLRAIPFNSFNHYGSNYYMFSPIFYKRLNTKKVTSIEIKIIDSLSYFVNFSNRVRIVLHFRKVNNE